MDVIISEDYFKQLKVKAELYDKGTTGMVSTLNTSYSGIKTAIVSGDEAIDHLGDLVKEQQELIEYLNKRYLDVVNENNKLRERPWWTTFFS